jgi:predicted PurR-regulated permease PerM
VTVERKCPVRLGRPVPDGGPGPYAVRGTMAAMSPGAAPKIQIPRWIQLVGLPLLLVLAWVVAGRVFHAVFLFLVATLVALLLDPLVNGIGAIRIGRFQIRRGVSVALVYLSLAAVLIVSIWALATVVVDQTKTAANRFDTYFTEANGRTGQTDADRDVDRLQHWLNTHGLSSIKVQERGHRWVKDIRDKDVGKYTNRIVDFVEGAAISIGKLLFSLIVVLVASIYMLLDFSRLARAIDRRFPPHPGSQSLLVRVEHAVAGYVKGQLLVSLIIGASAGLGMWVLGALGWVPGADKYALLFGAWAAVTELIPYLGPWLGAIPAGIYAVVVHPISLLWVAILFLFIHQIEGHIVVPNVMGSALRLHPLLVIFGLLAGGEIYGLPGILVALPLLAATRAIYEFFSERVALEPWTEGGPVPVEVEVEPPVRPPPPIVPMPDPAPELEAETDVLEPPPQTRRTRPRA